MKKRNAFPLPNPQLTEAPEYRGMNKIEFAAIKILAGILSNPLYAENVKNATGIDIKADPEQTVVIKAYSKLAIDFATELLNQLENK